ncbi:MAG: hypothetical protein VR64_16970 [Desulfatitalea sp. BRH_c12]|nr:MAG: hypothetical protein VR64_16970 [Desulfatitalea sp. BRH_c12]
MLNLTIPLWLLLTAAGLPSVCLVMLVLRLMHIKAVKGKHLAHLAATKEISRPEGFSVQIHQQILEQQIDAVFNALGTIMETERVKLKVLVKHSWPAFDVNPVSKISPVETVAPLSAAEEDPPESLPSSPSISGLKAEGLTSEEIARHLGLSHSEVALALKMKAGRKNISGCQMRAVA